MKTYFNVKHQEIFFLSKAEKIIKKEEGRKKILKV